MIDFKMFDLKAVAEIQIKHVAPVAVAEIQIKHVAPVAVAEYR
jgi:hypothetical protein